jgi:hypothetical protein
MSNMSELSRVMPIWASICLTYGPPSEGGAAGSKGVVIGRGLSESSS